MKPQRPLDFWGFTIYLASYYLWKVKLTVQNLGGTEVCWELIKVSLYFIVDDLC